MTHTIRAGADSGDAGEPGAVTATSNNDLYRTSQQGPQLAVTSQLMTDYRLARAVSAIGAVALAPTGGGQVEVFSVGSDGHVYNVYPDGGSDTGWSVTDLDLGGRANFVAAVRDADVTSVYALDTSNTLWVIDSRRWGQGWRQVPNPPQASIEQIMAFPAPQGAESFLGAMCFTRYPSRESYSFYLFRDGAWQSLPSDFTQVAGWAPGLVQSTAPGNAVWPGAFAAVSTTAGSAVYSGCYADGEPDVYGRFADGAYSTVTCVLGGEGYCDAFAVSAADASLCYLAPSPDSPTAYSPVRLSGATQVATAVAGCNAAGFLEVFALGRDQLLYHCRRDPGVPGGWTSLVCLDTQTRFSQLAACPDDSGETEVFAVSADGVLVHVLEDPDTTDWVLEQCEVAVRGSVSQIDAYTLRLTAYQAGQPVPGTGITLSSDGPVLLEIDGRSCFLDAEHPWQGLTGHDGSLTIGQHAGKLGAGSLAAWADFMPPGDRVLIDPSGTVRADLTRLDEAGQALLTAMSAEAVKATYNEVQLVQGDQRNPAGVAHVAKALKRAMTLAGGAAPGQSAAPGSPVLHPANDPYVARYAAGHDGSAAGRIDMSCVPEQHWRIGTSSGELAFQTLTAQETAEARKGLRRLPAVGEVRQPDGIPPLPTDWGDVFTSIANGAASVADVVISAVGDAIEASITLLIQGVEYLFEAGIEFIEQVLDLAQEIFNLLRVAFDRLKGWLGWVPNWQDILRTHRALAYLPSQLPVLVEAALTKARDSVIGVIGDWQTRLKEALDDYVATIVPPGTTIGDAAAFESAHFPGLNLVSDQRNINFTAFRDYIATTGMASYVVPEDLMAAVQTLINRMEYYSTQFQSSAAFARAVAYFSQIADDPGRFLDLSLAGLVELAGALALLALDAAKTVIGLVIDAMLLVVKAITVILTESWDIWKLSDLYAWLTDGATLSAVDVYALVLAIPVTLTYKAMFNDQVPFPTDASLAAFEASYSGEQLVRLCGLGTATGRATAGAVTPLPDAVPAAGHDGMMGVPPTAWAPIVLGVNYILYGLAEVVIDPQPPVPSGDAAVPDDVLARVAPLINIGSRALSVWNVMGLIAEWGIVIWGNPGFGPDPQNWDPHNDASLGNWLWVVRLFEPFLDTAAMMWRRKLMRSISGTGAALITGWGVFDCAIGIWQAVAQGDKVWPNSVANVLSTVPEMTKVLRTEALVYETPLPGYSLYALAALDATFDALTGGFYMMSSRTGRSSGTSA
jgi:hypothetical protein